MIFLEKASVIERVGGKSLNLNKRACWNKHALGGIFLQN